MRALPSQTLRPGTWARRRSRLDQLAYVPRIWGRLGVFTLGVVTLSIAALVLFQQRAAAFAVGVFDASMAWMVLCAVVQESGTASAMAGGDAEEWTATELKKLGSKCWHVMHDVPLEPAWDADHI